MSNWEKTIEGKIIDSGIDSLRRRLDIIEKEAEDGTGWKSSNVAVELDAEDKVLGVWFCIGDEHFCYADIPWSVIRAALAIHDAEMKEAPCEQ